MENQDGSIKIDGNNIIYRGTGYKKVSTSQAIPANLRSFIFKAKIVECSKYTVMRLGFIFDGGSTRWTNNTEHLSSAKGIITTLESYGGNDDICCHLRRIFTKQKDYQYVKWIKNGKVIGSCMMEGENIFPSIAFDTLHDSIQTAKLEASFDIELPGNASGKFHMTQK